MNENIRQIKGISISGGITHGLSRLMMPGVAEIAEVPLRDEEVSAEISSLDSAIDLTVKDLEELKSSAGEKIGSAVAKIFEVQLMIATDSEFLTQIKDEIKNKKRNVAYIYNAQTQVAISPLKNSSDKYMQQMAKDIEAVASRIISHLSGDLNPTFKFPPNTILVGRYFTPGEILMFRQRKAIGFIVSDGGVNSHMALIARSLMLPIVRIDNALSKIANNHQLILDGSAGEILIDPTEPEMEGYRIRKKKLGASQLSRIKGLKDLPPKTADNHTVQIAGNLSLPGPAEEILAASKIPVGLFRSEFLYLACSDFPDEEEQYLSYLKIAEKFDKTEVVIRTFDLGYDKLSAVSYWADEDNPALGWRGIRPMLEMTDLFKTQIRAILKASHGRNFKIMLPMISDVSEYRAALSLIEEVKQELRADKIEFAENIDVGIMVEVPSAALMAEKLASIVDFISIGTNDLTQYTLAADRMNAKVASLYDSLHPSVLKLIEQTVKACKKFKKPVSICGELAGDSLAIPFLIGLGVDSLSMNPGRIVDSCRLINKINMDAVEELAENVLNCDSVEDVKYKLNQFLKSLKKRKIRTKEDRI